MQLTFEPSYDFLDKAPGQMKALLDPLRTELKREPTQEEILTRAQKVFPIAVEEYKAIWHKHGSAIIQAWEQQTELKFDTTPLKAYVRETFSRVFHPNSNRPSDWRGLRLRASYTPENKMGTLTHELGHILLYDNLTYPKGFTAQKAKTPETIEIDEMAYALENHKLLDLVLFDVWTTVFGEEFARKQVEVESGRQWFYKKAWEWALSFDKATRLQKFKEFTTLP